MGALFLWGARFISVSRSVRKQIALASPQLAQSIARSQVVTKTVPLS